MSDDLLYDVGTISLTNNSATVTGSGTLWLVSADYPRLMPGDELVVLNGSQNPIPYVILSVDSDTSITLSRPYQGSTQSGRTYKIYKTSPFRNETPRLLSWVRDLIGSVENTLNGIVFESVSSFANQAKISNAISGSNPNLSAIGTDANIGLDYTTKGSGAHRFYVGSTLVASIVGSSLLLGYPSSIPVVGNTGIVQINSSGTVGLSITRNSNNSNAPGLFLAKSRAAVGSNGIVQSGDVLGRIAFVGDDGTDFATIAADIQGVATGTVGADQIPGEIRFRTANASGTLTNALTISNTQQVSVAANTAAVSITTGSLINAGGFGNAGNAYFGGVVYISDGSNSAPGLAFAGDANTGLYRPEADTLAITTGGTRRFSILSGGTTLISSQAAAIDAAGISPALQIAGANTSTASLSIINAQNNGNAPFMVFGKARGGLSATTAPNSGDNICDFRFAVYDGTDFDNYGARLVVTVSGTPASDSVGGRFRFYTGSGASSPTERWSLEADGTWQPAATNTYNIGATSARVATIYAQNALNTSDRRAKANFTEFKVMDRVRALPVWAYDYFDAANLDEDGVFTFGESKRKSFGAIAQDWRKYFPEIVFGDEEKELLSINEAKIGIIAYAGLREYAHDTDRDIAALTARLAAAEHRIAQLEGKQRRV